MKKTIMLLTASLGLAAAPGAWAAVIFNEAGAVSSTVFSNVGEGMNFRTGSTGSQLSEVMLRMAAGGVSGGGFSVSLYKETGVGNHSPAATALLTLTGEANPFAAGNYTYTGSYALAANTDYWIVLACTSGQYETVSASGGVYPSVGSSPYGMAVYYEGAWEVYGPPNFVSMQISSLSAVPEPSEWAAISFGVLGIVWVAKRRFMPARA